MWKARRQNKTLFLKQQHKTFKSKVQIFELTLIMYEKIPFEKKYSRY